MKPKATLAALALLFAATYPLPVRATEAAVTASGEAVNADTVLRQMSEKLSAARKFSFKVHREIDSGQTAGDGLPGNARIAVTVQRPDKVLSRSKCPDDVRVLCADGKNLSLSDTQKKLYSTVPMVASLDELPAKLATIYGFTPPVAEFIISDLYKDIVARVHSITYAGAGTIKTGFLGLKRVPCHRITLSGKMADSELWIAVGDLLPWRWTSNVKIGNNPVRITLDFSDWNLEANTKDEDFVFTPAKGAMQIPMMTVAEMEAASAAAK